MTARELLFDTDARDRLKSGIDALSDADWPSPGGDYG
jgi:hypothetical protein